MLHSLTAGIIVSKEVQQLQLVVEAWKHALGIAQNIPFTWHSVDAFLNVCITTLQFDNWAFCVSLIDSCLVQASLIVTLQFSSQWATLLACKTKKSHAQQSWSPLSQLCHCRLLCKEARLSYGLWCYQAFFLERPRIQHTYSVCSVLPASALTLTQPFFLEPGNFSPSLFQSSGHPPKLLDKSGLSRMSLVVQSSPRCPTLFWCLFSFSSYFS